MTRPYYALGKDGYWQLIVNKKEVRHGLPGIKKDSKIKKTEVKHV